MRFAMMAALVVIASCGDADGGPDGSLPGGAYSCRAAFPGEDTLLCLEASGGTSQDLASNRQQCAAQGNTFAEEPCPREGALGGCRETVAGSSLEATIWYYADGSSTAADIRMLCEGLASVAPSSLMIEFVLP